MAKTPLYALIDCNNFYASCEQLFDPKIRNHPVVVLSNNDGCIISRSKEAKALGLPLTGPLFKNRDTIKKHNVAIRSSNYTLYGDISARIMSALSQHTTKIEVYSIDEAFIELSNKTSATAQALHIQKAITQNIGIPISIGIAHTKTRAKIANEIAKKDPDHNGIFQIPQNIPETFFQKIPIQDVWGIGYRNARKLRARNIETAYDLMQQSDTWIKQKLTIQGLRTVHELRGTPCLSLEDTTSPQKNINVSRSFGKHVTDLIEIEESIAYYTSIAAAKLRKQNLLTNYIYVYLTTGRHRNHPQYKNSLGTTLPIPTDQTSTLIKESTALIRKIFNPGFIYYKTGVCFSSLTPNSQIQTSLLTTQSPSCPDSIIDTLNRRFGSETLTYASTGLSRPWQMKRNHKSPSYTTNWRELPIARAN